MKALDFLGRNLSNHVTTGFFGLSNQTEFLKGIQYAVHHLKAKDGIYAGDNLFVYNRSLGFLDDVKLMTAFRKHATTPVEQAILWRLSVVAWGAKNGLRLEGDFVECACYKGTTARIVCDYLILGAIRTAAIFFTIFSIMTRICPIMRWQNTGDQLFDWVKARFSDTPNVTATQGKVPDVLAETSPRKIAFMHLDLNNADAEVGALGALFDRMVPGAVLILDDYGWLAYRAQNRGRPLV